MDPNADPDLPDPLARDLSAVYGAQVRVSPEVDRVVTSSARAHFARRGRWMRWAGVAAGVAAVVVLSMLLVRPLESRRIAHTTAAARSTLLGDANTDGRVDIRDALSLARRIEAGSIPPTPRDDVNVDRVVDRKDVDAIAMLAVRLDAPAEVVR